MGGLLFCKAKGKLEGGTCCVRVCVCVCVRAHIFAYFHLSLICSFLLRSHLNNIRFTIFKCTIQWFSVYSYSCTIITTINFGTFHWSLSPQSPPRLAVAPHFFQRPLFTPRQPLTCFLLPVCRFACSGHMQGVTCNILCLSSFTRHVFQGPSIL